MMSVIEVVMRDYPFIRPSHATKIQLGNALAAQGFRTKREERGMTYFAIPR